MSFNADLSDDISKVRFQVSDFGPVERLEDATITAVLADAGSVAAAVTVLRPVLAGLIAQEQTSGADQGTSWSYSNRQALLDQLTTAAAGEASAFRTASGTLNRTAPATPARGPDGNDPAYRGDLYRRGWRP